MLFLALVTTPANAQSPMERLKKLAADGQVQNDIMVFFGEIDRASSSFGGGGLRNQSQASNHAIVVVAALRTTVLRTRG